ncbi:MAG: L-seryl-tRNA(Sec) selenium transferase [Actinomycetota bacterium]
MSAEPGLRRKIPSVDAVLRSEPGARAVEVFGRPLLKAMLVQVLADVRTGAASGAEPPDEDVLLARAAHLASHTFHGAIPVINATGVVLHTGLGRAPLPVEAIAHSALVAGYTDLEVDRETGLRGKRTTRAERMLTAITGAQDALVVNNCAAALVLTLAALARRKGVLVSRGELIEIGGEFRIPDIMSASGAKLVEVGTTNRTKAPDYRKAIDTGNTALVLKVHPSNYRIVGFTASPGAKELATIAHAAGLPFVYDLGSGLLERLPGIPKDEPSATEALADGADLVTFSGDKLLGGPQAGIVLGRSDLIAKLRTHPIARAVRVDKMQVAALETVLGMYSRGVWRSLPVWRMLRESADTVHERARALAHQLDGELEGAHVEKTEAAVGGGSIPGYALPSWGVAVRYPDPPAMAARLRAGKPSVFCRVEDGNVLLDCRTVADDQLHDLSRAILYALEADDLADEEA